MKKSIVRSVLVLGAITAALAAPASAFALGDQYVTAGTFGPGGGVTHPTLRHYQSNAMSTPGGGIKWHVFANYPGGERTDQHAYFTTATGSVNAVYPYNVNVQVGCYRTSTAAGGGTGYRTNIYCVGTY